MLIVLLFFCALLAIHIQCLFKLEYAKELKGILQFWMLGNSGSWGMWLNFQKDKDIRKVN